MGRTLISRGVVDRLRKNLGRYGGGALDVGEGVLGVGEGVLGVGGESTIMIRSFLWFLRGFSRTGVLCLWKDLGPVNKDSANDGGVGGELSGWNACCVSKDSVASSPR